MAMCLSEKPLAINLYKEEDRGSMIFEVVDDDEIPPQRDGFFRKQRRGDRVEGTEEAGGDLGSPGDEKPHRWSSDCSTPLGADLGEDEREGIRISRKRATISGLEEAGLQYGSEEGMDIWLHLTSFSYVIVVPCCKQTWLVLVVGQHNLESHLDHDGNPLAITAADAVQTDEVLPWNWRDTSGNGVTFLGYEISA
ncbi:hypothetical protein J5N97_021998 [Dioscorea zingiberensis]|uniref:Uncharacterized protein n=1 Tax=Dioscorea zingiberensis TaxID=325984 RepID=A0A9D5HA56_9LILI|nr:hypothetical protein J5N97_021998 [Dioscorea zingiberensis]